MNYAGHFDASDKSVQYEFGYGLSYSTFSMSHDIKITPLSKGNEITSLAPPAKIAPGGNPHLWDELYEITATVKNTGKVAGATVLQLYLSMPDDGSPKGTRPVNVLRGFEKVRLGAGESQEVRFKLNRRDISNWDVERQQWAIPLGKMEVNVGFSSRDFQAKGIFTPIL